MPRVTVRFKAAVLAALLASAAPVLDAAGVAALAAWLKSVERGELELDADTYASFTPLLEGAVKGPNAGLSLDEVLLDAAALEPNASGRASDRNDAENAFAGKVHGAARAALVERLAGPQDVEVWQWMVGTVLPDTKQRESRRVAVVETLASVRDEDTLSALFETAAVRKPESLGAAALEALCGWPDARVTTFFLENASLGATPGMVDAQLLERHLEALASTSIDVDEKAVLERVAPYLAAPDWRESARALRIVRLLKSDLAYPVLIEALESWAARRDGNDRSKRIESDLADELRRRSGRAMGIHADRWRTWWNQVQEGKVPPPSTADDADRTEATFFSLRPSSHKVTFVIDRSGSMTAKFGETGHRTRHEEVIRQTIDYLRLSGPDTQFNVILFSNETLRYKPRLQQASPRNLETLERWLVENGPEGGTHLRDAVESALELGRDGLPVLAKLESDTIVVLCDGVTNEGPDWVVPTLDRINERAQVVFHCVQVGPEGDGTLEALTHETGGDYIQILR